MTVRFPERIREQLRGSTVGPALALFAALSTVFLFGEHRSYFYWDYDWVSSQSMAIAANLSVDHGFLMFLRQTFDSAGAVAYDPYNRFPIGTYAALKLAMLPFEGDLSAQIFVAKTLTVCFFCAAAATAWLALSRILCDRWGAAAAVLLAFSSYPMLYHADMVGEGFADLFGVMLAFHGMAVFVQDRRFRQLAIKTCIALTLGWHTIALIMPFVLFGLAGAAERRLRTARRSCVARAYIPSFRRVAGNALVQYGALSLVFAAVLLSFNFANEWFALDGEKAVTELPSVESMGRRVGLSGNGEKQRTDGRLRLFDDALTRIDAMAYPYAALDRRAETALRVRPEALLDGRAAGFLAVGACLAGLASIARRKTGGSAPAALALCGLFWVLIAPFTVLHPFEAIFLVGVLLIGWSAVFSGLQRLAGVRATIATTAGAAAVFGASCFDMSRDAAPARHTETPRGFAEIRAVGHDAESVRFLRALPGDFDAIRAKMPEGGTVWIATPERDGLRTDAFGARFAADFYLAGYAMTDDPAARSAADFLLTHERVEGETLLTPENREVFLYDRALYDR